MGISREFRYNSRVFSVRPEVALAKHKSIDNNKAAIERGWGLSL